MRSVIVISVLLGVAYAAPKKLATLYTATGPVIENEYIVTFNERVTDEQVESHHHKLSAIMGQFNDSQRVKHHYHIGKFRGYSANLNEKTLEEVREEMIVKHVHPNQVASIYQGECLNQVQAPWGLARVSQVDLVDDEYDYSSESKMGEGVDVYIIDTGIYIEHSDFKSSDGRARAEWGEDFIDGSKKDGNGHGTHVAGTSAGTKYGIAKKAKLIAVRVLGDGGSGSYDGVIAGINWVAEQHGSAPGRKSVANMSLGGGKFQAVNDAVEAAADKGVAFALAAGNGAGDACFNSPASAEVMAVGASDSDDDIAYFSDTGECVEIIAPGVAVDSAWITGPDSVSTLSGTSMAAPHVAGVMAKVLSDSDKELTPKELENILVNQALKDKIKLLPGQDLQVNLLLHDKC